MLVLKEIRRICLACPSSWEGVTECGRSVFIRYRWGHLSIRTDDNDKKSVVRGTEILALDYGEPMDGFLHYNELKILASETMTLPDEEINGAEEMDQLLPLRMPLA